MSNNYVGVAGMGMPRLRPRGANAPAGLLAVILIGLGVLSLLEGAWNGMPALYWLVGAEAKTAGPGESAGSEADAESDEHARDQGVRNRRHRAAARS